MHWRAMDRETLDAAYNNAAAVADAQAWLAAWREAGAARRAMPGAVLDQAYGPRPRNRIDLFPSGAKDAPLLLFFHGGYWQRNAKEGFASMADGALARGIDVALAGYTLCPEVTMTELVAEAQAAVAWVAEHAPGLGFGMRRLVLSGWSAGGHLAVSCIAHPRVDAALPISGVYDLAPIQAGSLNDALRMDAAEAERLSPIRAIAPSRAAHRVMGRGGAAGAPPPVGRVRRRLGGGGQCRDDPAHTGREPLLHPRRPHRAGGGADGGHCVAGGLEQRLT